MTKLLAVIVACLALTAVAAGCGGDDEGSTDTGGGATSAPAETSGGGGAEAPATGNAKGKEVVMKDIKFDPATVTVKTGETVTWVNDDSVGHDVTADGDSFSSGDPGGIQPGQDYAHEFADAGTFKYVCTVHPGMEGEVVVK